MPKHLIRSPFILSLFITAAAIFAYLSDIPFIKNIELKTVDLRFKIRGEISPGNRVVLAVVDEKSIDAEGKWVWPRRKIARLVDCLSKDGASVIAFDIGFVDPDDKGEVRTIEDIKKRLIKEGVRNATIEKYINSLEKKADNDLRLAEAISRSKARVVLGYFFEMNAANAAHTPAKQAEIQAAAIDSSRYQTVQYTSETAQSIPLIEAYLPESNIPIIARSTPYSGFFNMFPDPDGVVRWAPGVIAYKKTPYAHLSIKALSAYLDRPLRLNVADYGVKSISIGNLKIPTDELGRIMINYRGPAGTFKHISITDILHHRVDPSEIKNRIVLVGATAVGIYDLRVTPFENVFPGVEIHANIIDSVLARDFLKQPTWIAFFDILAMIFFGVFFGLFLPRVRALPGALTSLMLCAGYVLFTQYLFSHDGIVINLVYPLMVIAAIYVIITLYKFLVEESQKRFIKNAFSTYLSPEVVNQLIESPERLVLGGEKREITAFFSDVQGFTTISEKLSPEALVDLLNDLLTEMTDIILKHRGMVDKFEGDAIIAMFGAPNELKEHAKEACLASLEMQKRIDELRPKWEKEKGVSIKMRIGLFSGPAVVGNMGSKNRMDYTMMGDTVNTASRLEGANKFYGTYTMIGESTHDAARDSIFARKLDAINVVGKSYPVIIYELIGEAGTVDEDTQKMVQAYENGLEAYLRREWDSAIASFKKALAIRPKDRASKVMMERCEAYKQNPPPENWNGAYTMTSK